MAINIALQVQNIVDQTLNKIAAPRVLEAGCGAFAHLVRRPNWRFSGIDISRKQLERNDYLEEKILGDLETYPLVGASVDLIVCWWVLEHLSRPRMAMENMINALRPGGLLVLAFPSLLSVKGLVTKFAPHWFHVWFYRNVLNIRDAGIGDQAPFRAFLRLDIAPYRIRSLAKEFGMEVAMFTMLEANYQERLRNRIFIIRHLWRLMRAITKLITLGRVDINQTECFVVLRKGGVQSNLSME